MNRPGEHRGVAAWTDALARPEVASALREVYAEIAREIAARAPTCWTSGRCCNFDAYGHRLYVTGLEAAYTVTQLRHDALASHQSPSHHAAVHASAHEPGAAARPPAAPSPEPVQALTISVRSASVRSVPISASGATPPASGIPTEPETPPLVQNDTPALTTTSLTVASLAAARARGGCPFQVGNLCGVHALRPLGCRIYFCERGTELWQQDLSERMLARVRAVHDQFDIPYHYGEWRDMLGAFLPQDPAPASAGGGEQPAIERSYDGE